MIRRLAATFAVVALVLAYCAMLGATLYIAVELAAALGPDFERWVLAFVAVYAVGELVLRP